MRKRFDLFRVLPMEIKTFQAAAKDVLSDPSRCGFYP